MNVAVTIDRYHRTRDAYLEQASKLTLEIDKDTPEHLVHAAVDVRMREQHADLHAAYLDALIENDQALAAFREREVLAHERATAWATLRETAPQ